MSLTQMEVHKFFRYCNINLLINVALQSHWTLSNSEASPRIWTCITRLSHMHVRRIWARDYVKLAEISYLVPSWYFGYDPKFILSFVGHTVYVCTFSGIKQLKSKAVWDFNGLMLIVNTHSCLCLHCLCLHCGFRIASVSIVYMQMMPHCFPHFSSGRLQLNYSRYDIWWSL